MASGPREALAARLPRRGVGAEIGVFRGRFSERLLAVTRPTLLYLVDPWENAHPSTRKGALYASGSGTDMNRVHDRVATRFATQIAAGTVRMVRSRSAEWLSTLPDDALDYAYVDGDHSYEAVKRDLLLCCDKVKPGGMIGVDDYSIGNWWGDGVVRAAHEVLAERRLRLLFALGDQVLMLRLPGRRRWLRPGPKAGEIAVGANGADS